MKITLTSILFLIVSLVHAQDFKALDDKNGFRDHKFGDNISSFTNLVLKETNKDGMKIYSKSDEDFKIGNYTVQKILYGFYRGKLGYVSIDVNGNVNSRGVLEKMNQQFGDGYQSDKHVESYVWFGELVLASYEENSTTHDAKIFFFSKPISDQQKKDAEDKNKNAKGF